MSPACLKERFAAYCTGEATADRGAWASELSNFCWGKYADPQVSAESQNLCRLTWRSIQQANELDGEQILPLSFGVTLKAMAAIRNGKAAGGGDDMIPEMLTYSHGCLC